MTCKVKASERESLQGCALAQTCEARHNWKCWLIWIGKLGLQGPLHFEITSGITDDMLVCVFLFSMVHNGSIPKIL